MSETETTEPKAAPPGVTTSLPPPSLVTATGEHPALVLPPESLGRFVAGLAVDGMAIVCITVLILAGKVTASEGLPWLAVLVGVRTTQVRRGRLPIAGAGVVLGILGITKGA